MFSTNHRFGSVHTGNKVDRIGDKVDRNKLSNSSCCQFVAKTGNKVDHIGTVDIFADLSPV